MWFRDKEDKEDGDTTPKKSYIYSSLITHYSLLITHHSFLAMPLHDYFTFSLLFH
ncbi:MAG: hypothetical protein F6K47_31405 [Symploca sp. SIO2E6]|nr:hypothetical protein [Symploca sp. SIO2E6]